MVPKDPEPRADSPSEGQSPPGEQAPPRNDGARVDTKSKRVSGLLSKISKDQAAPDSGAVSSATDFSLDSMDGFDSEPPLVLSGDAASTNLSDADPSSGTVSEPSDGPAMTVDLSSHAIEHGDVESERGGLTGAQPSAARTKSVGRAPPYRPTRRPPMAILRVYDDGSEECEEVRIRKTPFDIGRLDGDLVIPHELQMSRRHLRIDRTQVKTDPTTADRSLAEWTLTDLRSLNGTFFKKSRLQIRDHAEVLIGGELVRLELPEESDSLVITKVGPGKTEERLTVAPGTVWIGSDRSECLPLLAESPFLDPRHLRLDADRRGRWSLSDLGSTNGLWVRVDAVTLTDGDQWQCGEQRFSFTLP